MSIDLKIAMDICHGRFVSAVDREDFVTKCVNIDAAIVHQTHILSELLQKNTTLEGKIALLKTELLRAESNVEYWTGKYEDVVQYNAQVSADCLGTGEYKNKGTWDNDLYGKVYG